MMTDDERFKTDILLKEYDTLRSEIMSRTTSRFGILSIGGVLTTFIASQPRGHLTWIVTGLCVGALLALWWCYGVLIDHCATRIREIEQKVNHLAGDDILLWESRSGTGGIFPRGLLIHRLWRR